MRVVMRAGFDTFTGYGNDAVDIALWMESQGIDVIPFPTGVVPGLPVQFAKMLTKDPTAARPDVCLFFAPPFDMHKSAAEFGVPVVGYSMWERTPIVPQDVKGHGWKKRDRADDAVPLGWLKALAVTCPMNVEAFGHWVAKGVPTAIVPGGIDVKQWPFLKRDPSRAPMRFLNVGMLNGRKNPFALLDVWKRLTQEVPGWDATLHLHTTTPGLHPAITEGAYGPGITMSLRPLNKEQMVAMYHGADVFVSTSRGEGNNKPPMEFMATGGTVIATNWSGHQNWLSPEVTFPVGGALVPAMGRPEAVEFEVDRDDLFDAMHAAWKMRSHVARMGEAASRFIASACSWDATLPRLVRLLEENR